MPKWNKEIPGLWKVTNLNRGSGEGPYEATVIQPDGNHNYLLTAVYYGGLMSQGKRKYKWIVTKAGRDKPVTTLSEIRHVQDYLLKLHATVNAEGAPSLVTQQSPRPLFLPQEAVPPADSSEFSAEEGDHIIREVEEIERCGKLVAAAKEENRSRNGGILIVCEACALSDKDSGLFDAHHKVPLAMRLVGHATRVSDLAVLCPTCHRWAHVKTDKRFVPLPVEQIRLARLAAPLCNKTV